MLFSSYAFIFAFLPICLIGYYLLLKIKLLDSAKHWLFLCSLFFYGYWNMKYIFLIMASIVINYSFANLLTKPEKRISKKNLLRAALLFNIGLLCYYKYMDFFISSINAGFGTDFNLWHIIFPLGISFFTLQQIAFLIDVYEGLTKEKNFIDYALFVSFFPHVISGPIVHYGEMMPQYASHENKKFIPDNFSRGIFIFCIGLAKKVLIADTLAQFVNPLFDDSSSLSFFPAWGASLSYTFQLYFDFSGYTDMAIGLGLLFNIKIPKNFNSPFKALNIIDFWNRWHITLTQFITTYIFTPLVRSMPKMNFNYMMLSMFITMTIAGLWHGAAWTFVIYGMLHGLAIVINHVWKKTKIKLPSFLAWFLSFNFINICFTIFRAKSFPDAMKVFEGMLGFNGLAFPKGIISKELLKALDIKIAPYMSNADNLNLLILILSFVAIFKLKNSMEMLESVKLTNKVAIASAFIFTLSLFGLNQLTDFIYFNF